MAVSKQDPQPFPRKQQGRERNRCCSIYRKMASTVYDINKVYDKCLPAETHTPCGNHVLQNHHAGVSCCDNCILITLMIEAAHVLVVTVLACIGSHIAMIAKHHSQGGQTHALQSNTKHELSTPTASSTHKLNSSVPNALTRIARTKSTATLAV